MPAFAPPRSSRRARSAVRAESEVDQFLGTDAVGSARSPAALGEPEPIAADERGIPTPAREQVRHLGTTPLRRAQCFAESVAAAAVRRARAPCVTQAVELRPHDWHTICTTRNTIQTLRAIIARSAVLLSTSSDAHTDRCAGCFAGPRPSYVWRPIQFRQTGNGGKCRRGPCN